MPSGRPTATISAPGFTKQDGSAVNIHTVLGDDNDATYTTTDTLEYFPPNVVVVFDDDVTEPWLQSEWIKDPDGTIRRNVTKTRLKDAGMWMFDFMVCFCVCAPSRGTYMSGQPWWQSLIAQEGTIDEFDYTNSIWSWAWGTPTVTGSPPVERLYQNCHWGKVLNGWGTPALPVPPFPFHFSFDEFYGVTASFESKSSYSMWRQAFDATGASVALNDIPIGGYTWTANYAGNNPATFDDYEADKCMIDVAGFMDRAASRDPSDPRYNKPMFITVATNLGHTPNQKAPVRTPDATNRAARFAQWDNWVTPIYDTRVGTGSWGVSGTATATSATSLTDTTQTWERNRFRGYTIHVGTKFAVVLHDEEDDYDPHTLHVGEWYVGPPNSTNSFSTTSTPAPGVYSVIRALPDVDQTDVSHVQGTGGVFSANPGQNVTDERRNGQDLCGTEDIIETICAKFEQLGATNPRYALANTIILYWSDNGFMRGQKGEWQEKSFLWPQDFHVPCIWVGPGVGIQHGESNFHMTNLDLAPTLCSFMGVTPRLRDGLPVAGLDLSEQLRGNAPWPTNRAFIINVHPRGSTKGMLTSEWFYFHQGSPAATEPADYLINWRRDPYGMRNLWNSAEVTGGPNIQQQLVNLTNAYYDVTPPPAPLADLTFP